VAASGHAAVFTALKSGGLLAAAGSVGGLLVMMVLAGHPEALATWALKIERVVPARVAAAIAKLVQTFLEGLAIVRQPRRLAMALLLSLPVWLAIAGPIYLGSRAFHIDMSYPGAFLMMAILVVGVAVPTPGSVGGYHKAYQIGAVAFFCVANDRAVGAAVVLHAISFLPVTIAGVIFLAQEGLSLAGLRGLASSGPPGDAP
jgi:glycosyltransferase 2 family protein